MASTEDRLREREKELACVYSICLLAAGGPDPRVAAEGIARALCAAMQHESKTNCTVTFEKIGTAETVSIRRGPAFPENGTPMPSLEAPLPDEESVGWRGNIRIEYRDPGLSFLPQEKALLDSILVIAASILRTSNLITRLRATSEDLTAKNVALREVLSAIEAERRETLRAFRERMASEILPLAERARDKALTEERRDSYLDLLAKELERDVDAIGRGPEGYPALSPREREIAVQVRNGRTSKEIAELLGISRATVERHRHNLRRKLRVSNRGVNLAGLLSGMSSGSKDILESNL